MNKNAAAITFATIFTIGAAVFAYSQNTNSNGVANPKDPKQVALGKKVYAETCASCHGENFEGEQEDWKTFKEDDTLPAPPHNDKGHTWHHGDALLFKYTKEGGQSIGGPDFKSGMPGFAEQLSDDEVWAALAYIKTSWTEKQLQRQSLVTEREKE